jgi:hypothetical protein
LAVTGTAKADLKRQVVACFVGGPNVKILVTGSSGLIGSEAVSHFDARGHEVVGVDNNMRRIFFGPPGIRCGILRD